MRSPPPQDNVSQEELKIIKRNDHILESPQSRKGIDLSIPELIRFFQSIC